MSLFDRRKFVIGAFFLVGCGYAPVHGTDPKTKKIYTSVFVQAPKNRVEFELVRNLEKQFRKNNSGPVSYTHLTLPTILLV